MVKRLAEARVLASPGLREAPVLDRMCSHFVLTLTVKHACRFNLRRDFNGLLSFTGRHLVWPTRILNRLREFLLKRCEGNELWRGHENLSDEQFLQRHGVWNGPFAEATLFFYLDEYIKDAPKDILALLATTCEHLDRMLKRESTLVEKNIASLGQLLQLNPAERAILLYGTLARYQRELRGALVEFKVNTAREAFAAIAAVAGVNEQEVAEALRAGSRLERIGMVENLISEHNITDLADLMKVSDQLPPVLMREYRDPNDLMAVFTRPAVASTLTPHDFQFVEKELGLLGRLLSQAVARHETGVNVLLYGPPGTGKTELAKVAA
ncbi:MAG: ATP-binding protein, partial [Paucibacter sp.]|nr:ATP-binding protein [Roseateles sp.]